MAHFVGADGERWELRITTPVLRRIARDTGLDLMSQTAMKRMASGDLGMIVYTNAIWIICEKQARARGYDEDAFYDRALAPHVLPGCVEVLLPAIVESLTPPGEAGTTANPPAQAVADNGSGPTF